MSNDYPHAVIQLLITDGESLREANDTGPGEDAFVAWIDRVREILTEAFGHGHRFVVDVEETAQGAAHSPRDAEPPPAGYFRVLTIVALTILRRAALDLQRRPSRQGPATPRVGPSARIRRHESRSMR